MTFRRVARVSNREPRSLQGFGRGKSITYDRLSPPLSAFNHTLCEQNIKTCPFVCRRRIVVDRGGRGVRGAGSGAGSGRPGPQRTLAIPRVYLAQSFARCSYKEVRFCTAT